jgi:hypothetical protein
MLRKLGILTLYSQNILSTLMFVVKYNYILILNIYIYIYIFNINIELDKINTRHKLDFHVPLLRITKVQKGVYYSGITLFNALPLNIKQASYDTNQYKHKFKIFLTDNSFCSVEEYLHMNKHNSGASQ